MLSVLLVEDNDAHAELFELKLNAIEGLNFDITRCGSGDEVIQNYPSLSPSVVFMDYRLGDTNGVDLIERLRSLGVGWPIVVLTGQGDEYVAARITRAGADDYLVKDDITEDRLIDALDRALALNAERQETGQEKSELRQRLATLTARESEVLDAIMAGKTNKEIASDFSRSIKTIKIHRSRVMTKMNAQTPAELARLVMLARD
ncbi:MAG: response regulator [Planctomycetota bacterium]